MRDRAPDCRHSPIYAAIDMLGELYAKYGNLLTASVYPILVPAIQHPWLAVFRQPWMPEGWEPPPER
jgi:hypothetical protein